MTEDFDEIVEAECRPTSSSSGEQKPLSRIGHIVCEGVAGIVAGLIGTPLGLWGGMLAARWLGEWTEVAMGYWVLGGFVGYAVFSPIGVYRAGRLGEPIGSFWATWFSGPLALGLAYVCLVLCDLLSPEQPNGLLAAVCFYSALALGLAGPVVFPVIAFHVTGKRKVQSRRYEYQRQLPVDDNRTMLSTGVDTVVELDLQECTHCNTRGVLPTSDGRCPNCKHPLGGGRRAS